MSIKRLSSIAAALTAFLLIGAGAASAQIRGDFHESGVIAAMTSTSITVNELVFDIASATLDDEGTLGVGVLVDIDYFLTAHGRAIATEVEIDGGDDNDDDDANDDLHAAGVVTAMTGTTITVNGIVFDISTATLDDEGTLGVGVSVDIDYILAADGAAVATEVEIDGDDDDDDDDDIINGCVRPAGWFTYEIRRGDTLSHIAQAAQTTIEALVTANCLTSANVIVVGQDLFVPVRITNSGSSSSHDDDDDDDDNSGHDDDDDDDDSGESDDDNGNDDSGSDDDNGGSDDSDDDDDNSGHDDDDDDDDGSGHDDDDDDDDDSGDDD